MFLIFLPKGSYLDSHIQKGRKVFVGPCRGQSLVGSWQIHWSTAVGPNTISFRNTFRIGRSPDPTPYSTMECSLDCSILDPDGVKWKPKK